LPETTALPEPAILVSSSFASTLATFKLPDPARAQ
jgi:hypothetical protein